MSYAERIVDYLQSIAPAGATNSQIARQLNIAPHQTVFSLTQKLFCNGQIRGSQQGHEWIFYGEHGLVGQGAPSGLSQGPTSTTGSLLDPAAFEEHARQVFSGYFSTALTRGAIPGVRKHFDLVSADRQIVGDAKYYTLVRGVARPPAKFATIAEHVWLLEKTRAPKAFLVFGNDRRVPNEWLERYGNLLTRVSFYFLTERDDEELLASPTDHLT